MSAISSPSRAYIPPTPDSRDPDLLVALAEETQQISNDALMSPSSLAVPETQLGRQRDPSVEQALGPTSQLLFPPSHPSTSSSSYPSRTAATQSPFQIRNSPPQSSSTQFQPSCSSQNDESALKASAISSVSAVLGHPQDDSLNTTASDSQPFKYDATLEDSQGSFQATQLDSQSLIRSQADGETTDNEGSSRSIVGPNSLNISQQPSTRNENEQVSASAAGRSSGRGEEGRRDQKKPRDRFQPSSHLQKARGTPVVQAPSRILVAETPQTSDSQAVSSSPSSSVPGARARPSSSNGLGASVRPSSPLSDAPGSPSNSPAFKAHRSLSSTASVRREPAAIALRESSPIHGSPPSPSQATSSRPSRPVPHQPSSLPTRQPPLAPRRRPGLTPPQRSSSQIPETQQVVSDPLAIHPQSTESITIPTTAPNPSGSSSYIKTEEENEMAEEVESNFGNSTEENSGERARKEWLREHGHLYRGNEKAALGPGEEDDENDFLQVMDVNDLPASFLPPHEAPLPPTPPRRRPVLPSDSPTQSSDDPLAEAYVSQATSHPLPYPTSAPRNAVAGLSDPAPRRSAARVLKRQNDGPPLSLAYTASSLIESQTRAVAGVVPPIADLDGELLMDVDGKQLPALPFEEGAMHLDLEEEDEAVSNLPPAPTVAGTKRRAGEVERAEEDHEEAKGAEDRDGKRKKLSKDRKRKERAEEDDDEEKDTPARSTRGKSAGRGGKGGKGGGSSSSSKTISAPAKATTKSRNHLIRTSARPQAAVIVDGSDESDDETIEDADDSTWNAGPMKPKSKKASSDRAPTEDVESGADDDMEVDEENRDENEEEVEEPASLAPPPKPSPAKKTPYGSKGKGRGPRAPLLIPDDSTSRNKRRQSFSDSNNGGSPAPSFPFNAKAGPSRQPPPSDESSNRVFAPFGKFKHKTYYPATVLARDPNNDKPYKVGFDDGDRGCHSLRFLRKCILNPGDVFFSHKTRYIVASSQGSNTILQKGETVKAYEKNDARKKTVEILVETVTIPLSLDDQFSDRPVTASDILVQPAYRGPRTSTRSASAAPSVSSSSDARANDNKERAKKPIPGVSRPSVATGAFRGVGFVLTNCAARSSVSRAIEENGGTVGKDLASFYSVAGAKTGGSMEDGTYHAEDLQWNDAFGTELHTVLIVADELMRTAKMMKAAALGVPCVSTEWIEEARVDGRVCWRGYLPPKPKSHYSNHPGRQDILDAWGKDPAVLADPINYSGNRKQPLVGLKVLFLSTKKDERELVAFLCLAMGASSLTLVSDASKLDPLSADLFVFRNEETPPKKMSENNKAMVVDIEWVCQTVLHGQRRREQPMRPLVKVDLTDKGEAKRADGKGSSSSVPKNGGGKKRGEKG